MASQEKRKEGRNAEEDEEKETEGKGKVEGKEVVEEMHEVHHKSLHDEGGEKQRGEGKQTKKKDKTPQSKENVGNKSGSGFSSP